MRLRPRPFRIARALKRTGVILIALIGALWAIGSVSTIGYRDDRPGVRVCWCGVYAGCFEVCVMEPPRTMAGPKGPGWVAKLRSVPIRWLPIVRWPSDRSFFDAVIPLWMLLGVSAAMTACLWWWLSGHGPPGLCSRCLYDLAGLAPGSPCPECGRGRAPVAR